MPTHIAAPLSDAYATYNDIVTLVNHPQNLVPCPYTHFEDLVFSMFPPEDHQSNTRKVEPSQSLSSQRRFRPSPIHSIPGETTTTANHRAESLCRLISAQGRPLTFTFAPSLTRDIIDQNFLDKLQPGLNHPLPAFGMFLTQYTSGIQRFQAPDGTKSVDLGDHQSILLAMDNLYCEPINAARIHLADIFQPELQLYTYAPLGTSRGNSGSTGILDFRTRQSALGAFGRVGVEIKAQGQLRSSTLLHFTAMLEQSQRLEFDLSGGRFVHDGLQVSLLDALQQVSLHSPTFTLLSPSNHHPFPFHSIFPI